MLQLRRQEVLLGGDSPRSGGDLSHAVLPTCEQGERQRCKGHSRRGGHLVLCSGLGGRDEVVAGGWFLLPAAFSNTPLTLSTPLSSGSRWDATSHCTLHSSVCCRVSFTHAFHLSAACAQLEDASSWTAESYRACVGVSQAKEMLFKEYFCCRVSWCHGVRPFKPEIPPKKHIFGIYF